MFSGFPLDETTVVITKAVKLIKSPVQNNGKPENMTCWCALRTGVEKHWPKIYIFLKTILVLILSLSVEAGGGNIAEY